MADVARSHGGDCQGGPGGGDGPNDGWQPPSGCQSSGGSRKGRGKSRNKGLKQVIEKYANTTLPIEFEQNSKKTYIAVGDNRAGFTSLLGTIVSKIPRHHSSWKSIPEEERNIILDEIQSYFDIQRHLDGPNGRAIRSGIMGNCAKMYRDQKHKFKKSCYGDGTDLPDAPPQNIPADHWEKFVSHINSPEYVRRSAANKAVRAKQNIVVRTGSKSLAQARYENRDPVTNEPPSLIEEYARLRSRQGQVYPQEAADFYARMRQMKDAQAGVPNPLSEEQIMEDVLGPRRGWQKGIGPKLPMSLDSSSSGSHSSRRTYTQSEVEQMMSQMASKVMTHTAPLFRALNLQPRSILDDEDGEDEEGEEEEGEEDEIQGSD